MSSEERELLRAGGLVRRPLSFKRGSARYVGGIAYQLVRATPPEVIRQLQAVENLPQLLPYTVRAELVRGSTKTPRIELEQGLAPFVGRYTVHVVADPARDKLGFWLDTSRPSDLSDVWGFFRADAFNRSQSLLTVAVLLDLGPGLSRALFERQIQDAVLSTPNKIKDFVEPRALAARAPER